MPRGSDDFDAPMLLKSISEDMNVEHIFEVIPETGLYDIVVRREAGGPGDPVDYGLAWWYGDPYLLPEILPGDYDRNGMVDPQDYNIWRDTYGSNSTPGEGADGNGDGLVDAADYTVWRDAYATASATAAVPEPTAVAMALAGLLALRSRRRVAGVAA